MRDARIEVNAVAFFEEDLLIAERYDDRAFGHEIELLAAVGNELGGLVRRSDRNLQGLHLLLGKSEREVLKHVAGYSFNDLSLSFTDDVIGVELRSFTGQDLGKIHVALARDLVYHADRDILSRCLILFVCIGVNAEHCRKFILRIAACVTQTRYSLSYFLNLINHMKISSFSKKRFFTLLQ